MIYIITYWEKIGGTETRRIMEVDDREMMTELVDNLLDADVMPSEIKVYHAMPKRIDVVVEA